MATDTELTVDAGSPWGDGLGDVPAEETIQQQVVEAEAELAQEQNLGEYQGPPPELAPILEKYNNDPVRLAQAFKGLQAQITRAQQGKGPMPSIDPEQGQQQAVEGQQQQPAPGQEQAGQEQPQTGEGQLSPEQMMELTDRLYEAAGNQAQFEAVRSWARTNLPADRLQAFDAKLQSGDTNEVVTHFQAMLYEYTRARGFEGQRIGGRPPRDTGGLRPFASDDELVQAMMDPRYQPQHPQYSEAYHRQVIQRAALMGV